MIIWKNISELPATDIQRKKKKQKNIGKNFKIASIIERADELKGGGGRGGGEGGGQKLDPKKTSRSLTTIKRSDGDICVNKANSPGGSKRKGGSTNAIILIQSSILFG